MEIRQRRWAARCSDARLKLLRRVNFCRRLRTAMASMLCKDAENPRSRPKRKHRLRFDRDAWSEFEIIALHDHCQHYRRFYHREVFTDATSRTRAEREECMVSAIMRIVVQKSLGVKAFGLFPEPRITVN